MRIAEVIGRVTLSRVHPSLKAGRYVIDALKASVPIWKRETWREGSAWGTGATPVSDAGTVH